MATATDITQSPPSTETLHRAYQLAVTHDMPILFDYWRYSLTGQAHIRVDGKIKQLVHSEDEYTSTISSIVSCGKEYIIQTENSIYIVSSGIKAYQATK